MSAATTTTGEEREASPGASIWNGEKLAWHNGLGLRWAWQQGPKLAALKLGRREHLVLMSIAAHTDLLGHNRAYLGYTTLARETGFKRSSVSEAVRRLKGAKVLNVTEHDSGCNWYEIAPRVLARVVIHYPTRSKNRTSPESGQEAAQFLDGDGPESGREVVQFLDGGSPEHGPEEGPLRRTGEEGPGRQAYERASAANRQPVNRSSVLQETGQAKVSTASGPLPQSFSDSKDSAALAGPQDRPAENIPQTTTPMPLTPSTDPMEAVTFRVALQIWTLIGSPAWELLAAQTTWPPSLREEVRRDGGEGLLRLVTAAMQLPFYAVGTADFAPKLPRSPRSKEDSLGWILNSKHRAGMLYDVDDAARRKALPVTAAFATNTTNNNSTPKEDDHWIYE